jgi:hypothetical protein
VDWRESATVEQADKRNGKIMANAIRIASLL